MAEIESQTGNSGSQERLRDAKIAPARILIVDDNPWVRHLLSDYLAAQAYLVIQASDAEETFVAIDRDQPDLVLLDIGLPGAGGIEVLRRLRREHPSIGIIVITGNKDVTLAQEAYRNGAMDCKYKPFDLDRLGRAVAATFWRLRNPDAGLALT